MRSALKFILALTLIAALLWWGRAPLQEAAEQVMRPEPTEREGGGRGLRLFTPEEESSPKRGAREAAADESAITPGTPLIVELVEAPATHYGQPKMSDADTHYARLCREAEGLRYEATMGHAARELAGFHSQHGRLASGEVLSFLLDSGGAAEWTVEQLVTTTSREGDQPIRDLIARASESWRRGAPPLRIGIGEAWTLARPARRHHLALVSRGRREIDRVAREVPVDSSLRVTGRVPSEIPDLEILVMGPDLVVMDAALSRQGERFEAVIPMGDAPGQAWIELIGIGSQGPKPLAQLSVHIDQELPWTFETQWPPDESHLKGVQEAEAHALMLFNADRRRFGLPEVRRARALDRVARSHSEDMARHGFFAHVSPNTGSVSDRLQAAEVRTVFHGENIARNEALSDAQAGLMRSIGHRRNILHPRATEVGIGVAPVGQGKRRQWLLTQVVARPSPVIDAEELAQEIALTINAAREEAGEGRFKLNRRLEAHAKEEARSPAPSPQGALDLASDGLRRGGWAWIATLGELSDLELPEKILDGHWRRLGVGVYQDRERPSPNIVVVLIIGR